jgi:hypothetical protein
LDRQGIAEVLNSTGLTKTVIGHEQHRALLEQLKRLTDGDPLVLRLYVDELTAGEVARCLVGIEHLPEIPPGQDGFFKEWFRQLDLQPGKQGREGSQVMRRLLHLMATAFGALTLDDLTFLLSDAESALSVGILQDLAPVARFVIGSGKQNDGYRLTHARFNSYFLSSDMSDAERKAYETRFLKAGKRILNDLQSGRLRPAEAPAYFLRFFSDHLIRANEPLEETIALASEHWMDAWMALEPDGTGFLRDIERARKASELANSDAVAQGRKAPWLHLEILAAMCTLSVRSRVFNITPELAYEGLKQGIFKPDEAIALGMHQLEATERCRVLTALLNADLRGERKAVVLEAAYAAYGCIQGRI